MNARRTVRFAAALAAATLALSAAPALRADLTIDHEPVDCIIVDTFPELDAGFVPWEELEDSRVYFRAAGTEDWYYVPMEPLSTGSWQARLPKPDPSLDGVDYYLHARDLRQDPSRTDEHHPVVSTRTYCENQALTVSQAADTDDLELVIGLVRAGQEHIPPGFLPDRIARVVLPDGTLEPVDGAQAASASGGAASGAASGTAAKTAGSSALKWIGGAVLIGGAAVGASGLSSDDDGGGDGGSSGPPQTGPACGSSSQVRVEDSGAVSDDAFEVFLDGRLLGRTATGGGGSFQVCNISSGSHELRLKCVEDENPPCTYTIRLSDGVTFTDGQSTKSGSMRLNRDARFTILVP